VAIYTFRRAATPPPLAANWDDKPWASADTADIARFHPRSSDHHPRVQCRVLYDNTAVYGLFRAEDRYVRSIHARLHDPVCHDSCVEFFAQPKPDRGYFNFEWNAGGTLHVSYVEDPARTPQGLKKLTLLTKETAEKVSVFTTVPSVVEPEITEPVTWRLGFSIPYEVFEAHVGPVPRGSGAAWRGNFYKCADRTSHPHWGMWSDVGELLNFHKPECFGEWRFA